MPNSQKAGIAVCSAGATAMFFSSFLFSRPGGSTTWLAISIILLGLNLATLNLWWKHK